MKKTQTDTRQRAEQGFSLIELLIAMTVTVLVSGAVLTLLVEGNKAFRLQPDVTERQQNVRAAMDVIMRDVANAGAGLSITAQVFARQIARTADGGLVNVDGAGIASPSGTMTDVLAMVTNASGEDPIPACADAGVNVRVMPYTSSLKVGDQVFLLMEDGSYSVRTVTEIRADAGGKNCTGGVRPTVMFNRGEDLSETNPGGGPCVIDRYGLGTATASCTVSAIAFLQAVRYEIVLDADGVPVLQRRVGSLPPQVIARGIEDMQVTYRRGADITPGLAPNPESCPAGDASCPLPLTLPDSVTAVAAGGSAAVAPVVTVEVQVDLTARGNLVADTADPNAATSGTDMEKDLMTLAADGTRAFRQHLVSRGTPRSTLIHLAAAETVPRWQ